jgi:CubicO group peptidase (beta-lactamase class C family)
MVTKETLLAITLAVDVLVISGCNDHQNHINPGIESKVDLIIENSIDKSSDPGLTILIHCDGNTDLRKAYGLADVQTREAFRPQTPCFIGSLSKQFTATAIMILVERKRISLTDHIKDHFPEFPASWENVTIHHLLTHQSGISDYFNDHGYAFDGMNNGDALDYVLENGTMHFKPGDMFRYSNTGYIILAELVDKVAGKKLSAFCEEEIFSPLGMVNTYFVDENSQIPINRAIGHTLQGDIFDYTIRTIGDGGMISTVDDMLIWDTSHYSNLIVSQETLSTMMTGFADMNNGAYYGYGYIIDNYNGYTIPSQNGGFAGIFAYSGRIEEKKFYICMMANSPNYNLFEEIISTTLNHYFPALD